MEQPAAEAQEQGCAVDWGWLTGRRVVGAHSTLDRLVLTFDDGQTLTVSALLWKGQAFLSFDPWRAPG